MSATQKRVYHIIAVGRSLRGGTPLGRSEEVPEVYEDNRISFFFLYSQLRGELWLLSADLTYLPYDPLVLRQ